MGDLGFKLFYEKGLHATAALDSISTPLNVNARAPVSIRIIETGTNIQKETNL